MERAQAGTRVSLSVQAAVATAPAQPVSAGEQGQTLQRVVVALAQGLGPVWILSHLGGVCKLSACMGKYCDRMSLFKKFISGVDACLTS